MNAPESRSNLRRGFRMARARSDSSRLRTASRSTQTTRYARQHWYFFRRATPLPAHSSAYKGEFGAQYSGRPASAAENRVKSFCYTAYRLKTADVRHADERIQSAFQSNDARAAALLLPRQRARLSTHPAIPLFHRGLGRFRESGLSAGPLLCLMQVKCIYSQTHLI